MFAQVKYSKYHALGNDYLVISPENLAFELTPERIERICHRNFGIGSDGILFGPLPAKMRNLDCGFLIQMVVRQKKVVMG